MALNCARRYLSSTSLSVSGFVIFYSLRLVFAYLCFVVGQGRINNKLKQRLLPPINIYNCSHRGDIRHTHTRTRTHIHTYTHTHSHTHARTHARTHAHTHTHTHTHFTITLAWCHQITVVYLPCSHEKERKILTVCPPSCLQITVVAVTFSLVPANNGVAVYLP